MEQGLGNARLVLCICSEKYVEKANEGVGGVGYEKMIMTQDLLKNANVNYIIPIIRNNYSSNKTPQCLGSKSYIDFNDDDAYYDKYWELLDRIYEQDLGKKPALGSNPYSTKMADVISRKKAFAINKYYSPAMSGQITFEYDNNNGHFAIGVGEYFFDTKWSRAGNNSIYAYGNIGYIHGEMTFPNYSDIAKFDFSSNTRQIKKDEVFVLMNAQKRFAAIKVLSVKSSFHGFPIDEMVFKYIIYK